MPRGSKKEFPMQIWTSLLDMLRQITHDTLEQPLYMAFTWSSAGTSF